MTELSAIAKIINALELAKANELAILMFLNCSGTSKI